MPLGRPAHALPVTLPATLPHCHTAATLAEPPGPHIPPGPCVPPGSPVPPGRRGVLQGVETHLMMETSGHGAIKENHYLDDGAYLAVKV